MGDRVNTARKVIYTCITGGYDTLSTPSVKYDDYDYICFTDNPNLNSNVWQFRPIPSELLDLDLTRQSKIIKICPHKYLSEYDMSIYIDGNINLDFDLKEIIYPYIDDTHNVYVKRHPVRNCIYDELNVCIRVNKDNKELMQRQVDSYREQGFPPKFGLSENNIIVRFHNSDDCISLMNAWSDEIRNGSKRDQLSFSYCVWKTNTRIKYFAPDIKLRVTRHIRQNET